MHPDLVSLKLLPTSKLIFLDGSWGAAPSPTRMRQRLL